MRYSSATFLAIYLASEKLGLLRLLNFSGTLYLLTNTSIIFFVLANSSAVKLSLIYLFSNFFRTLFSASSTVLHPYKSSMKSFPISYKLKNLLSNIGFSLPIPATFACILRWPISCIRVASLRSGLLSLKKFFPKLIQPVWLLALISSLAKLLFIFTLILLPLTSIVDVLGSYLYFFLKCSLAYSSWVFFSSKRSPYNTESIHANDSSISLLRYASSGISTS